MSPKKLDLFMMVSALSLIGCCFEWYDAAVYGALVLALSADCVQTPLCIRCAVDLFARNILDIISCTTQRGIVVLDITTA